MDATIPNQQGWVLYDGECGMCTQLIQRLTPLFRRANLEPVPLQTDWVKARLGLTQAEDEAALLKEMRILTAGDNIHGGADAVIHLARQFWWAFPFVWLTALPGVKPLLNYLYQWVASKRHCTAETGCSLKR